MLGRLARGAGSVGARPRSRGESVYGSKKQDLMRERCLPDWDGGHPDRSPNKVLRVP